MSARAGWRTTISGAKWVRWPSAAARWPQSVAGILWNVVGWAFAGFVSTANNYTAIYSGFATPILFMIWLYVGWLILLVGATIAFYRQHPEYLSSRQLTGHLSAEDRERLALQAVCLIGERFYGQQSPPSAERIASALLVPANAVEQILEPLQLQGLLASTDHDPPGYLPGCPWEDSSVNLVLEETFWATRGRGGPPQPGRGRVD
jgi:membrane protein